jgi:hypothetical protein
MQKMIYHLGVDIGSTTIKFVVLDEKERIIFKDYFRHLSDPSTAFLQEIQKILAIIDGREFSLILTGWFWICRTYGGAACTRGYCLSRGASFFAARSGNSS